MKFDPSKLQLREPSRSPKPAVEPLPPLTQWPPLQRYLVAGLERQGIHPARAAALVAEASRLAGMPLDWRQAS